MGDADPAGLERLEVIARDALRRCYDVGPDAELTLLNLSENATYRVDDPVGPVSVVRVNRPGYHSRTAIESELAWVRALRDDGVVSTPHVLDTTTGERVGLGQHPDGETRHTVRFEWMPGSEPPEERLVEDFHELGRIAAVLHRHARTWRRPDWFTRHTWDYDTSVGPRGHWGRWQDGMGMGLAELEQLGRLDKALRRRLEAYGTGPERFGLVHADMRLANLLVDGRDVHVIDFDDCGFGWYMYDLGSSVSFIEHDPRVPEMIDSWVRGYRTAEPLDEDDVAELPTFVMLRRLLLVAWIGSHAETDLARSMGEEYTRVSCDIADDYLSRFA